MSGGNIAFHSEQIDFALDGAAKTSAWITRCIQKEGLQTGDLNIIFTSDPYLLSINQKYINHDYYTDVIAFDYCEGDVVSGDVFISIDRVSEHAKERAISMDNELHRVIIHGILHLCGYSDKTVNEKKEMTGKEDEYLNARKDLGD
jgi:rRNA maturation RNase YbeY